MGLFGQRSKTVPSSRRLVLDLMRISRRMPLYPLERCFELAELARLRQASVPRISWPVVFLKAYGLVADRYSQLRQTYMCWPWPHLYEHPCSVAMVAVNRLEGDQERIFWGRFLQPERQPLIALQQTLDHFKSDPISPTFRRQLRLSRAPAPLRRLAWWMTLNLSGDRRARRLGTFGMSTLGGQGIVNRWHPSCLTGSLSYGPLDPDGRMLVTVIFDHRVMDGAPLARALAALEKTLQTTIAEELRDTKHHSAAA
jgi:hypothetical protein